MAPSRTIGFPEANETKQDDTMQYSIIVSETSHPLCSSITNRGILQVMRQLEPQADGLKCGSRQN
jgi:hypothetical protein